VGVERVSLTQRYELQEQSGATADTIGSVGGAPWAVAGPRYVIIGSPLTADATNLPVQAAFVPWLARTIADRLSGEAGVVVAAAPGTWLRKPAGVDQLERPDGSTVAMADSLRVPATPGVYFFMTAGRRTGAVVVNPPARESQLDRMSAAELQQIIPGAVTIRDGDAAQLSTVAFSAASTRSLLTPILIGILIALMAEGLIVSAGPSTSLGVNSGRVSPD
jgi:hypothetical protein